MPFPAYDGVQFYFHIPVGTLWIHEFPIIDRNTGLPMEWEEGWAALCVIRNTAGLILATIDTTGTSDGDIILETGRLTMTLSSLFTADLPPTTTYGGTQSKGFVWADLTLTDPDNAEPYIAGRGKGVIYLTTTIGA